MDYELEKIALLKLSYGPAQNLVIEEVPSDTQLLGVTSCIPTWGAVSLWWLTVTQVPEYPLSVIQAGVHRILR